MAYRNTGQLTDRDMSQEDMLCMIRVPAARDVVTTAIGRHRFYALRISVYVERGGTLEKAQHMATHESRRG